MLKKENLPYICLLAAGTLWGFIGVFVRILADFGLSNIQIVVSRFMTVSIIFAVYIFIKDKKKFSLQKRDILVFAAFGIPCFLAYNITFAITTRLTSLSVAVSLLYTSPIWSMVFSVPVFKEKLTATKAIAIILSVVGCAFISGLFSSGGEMSPAGVILGLLSGMGYGSYGVIAKKLLKRYNSLTVAFYPFVFASLGGLFICKPLEMLGIIASSPAIPLYVFLGAFICFVLPFALFTYSLNFIEASKAAVAVSIEPVVATVIGLFMYGEAVTPSIILGIACILMAVSSLNSPKISLFLDNLVKSERPN